MSDVSVSSSSGHRVTTASMAMNTQTRLRSPQPPYPLIYLQPPHGANKTIDESSYMNGPWDGGSLMPNCLTRLLSLPSFEFTHFLSWTSLGRSSPDSPKSPLAIVSRENIIHA